MRKNRSIWESFNNAISGIFFAIKYERNIRIHFVLGLVCLVYSLFLPLSFTDRALVVFAIAFVIVTELLNTAIEHIIDHFISVLHDPMIKVVKDLSAGAVFCAAINATFIGYFILYQKSTMYITHFVDFIRKLQVNAVLFTPLFVMIGVVMLKLVTKSGSPFRGGFPSGHAAFSFTVFALTVLYTNHHLIMVLVFILAFFVSKSRIDLAIHTTWQVVSGALLGFFGTLFLNVILGGLV